MELPVALQSLPAVRGTSPTASIAAFRTVAERLFTDIGHLTFDGVGITRDSYGAGETATCDYLRAFAHREGLQVKPDAAGNLVFSDERLRDETSAVWIGSHVDSVPQGGNFDGLAGVLAGLLCLVARRRAAQREPGLRVIAFRGEESAWFGKPYLGSSALFGKLTTGDLQRRHTDTGTTLAEAMAAVGADVEAIRQQQVLVNASRIKAFIELHIEQGPVMVSRNLPLAVVSGIRGNVRHQRIDCVGDAQHSGAVPRSLRHDAVFSVSELLMRLDNNWRAWLDGGRDLVVTAGILQTDAREHAVSRVPGRATFSLEARSDSVHTLDAFQRRLERQLSAVALRRGVRFVLDACTRTAPARMDAKVCEVLSQACGKFGVAHAQLPSGAGHDAAVFAHAGIPTGMLFVRNQHGSHNPREAMDVGDFMLGVQVLSDAIDRFA